MCATTKWGHIEYVVPRNWEELDRTDWRKEGEESLEAAEAFFKLLVSRAHLNFGFVRESASCCSFTSLLIIFTSFLIIQHF